MKSCKYCKSEIDSNAKICPHCRKRQSKKTIYIAAIIIVSIIVLVGLAIGVIQFSKRKNESVSNNLFYSTVSDFNFNYLQNSANLENIANDIKKYWYESISEDKYDSDINVAIAQALKDNEDDIQLAKTNKLLITEYYIKITHLECYSIYCDDIKQEVENAYNTYLHFHTLAVTPNGSYNSYSEDFYNTDSDALKHYNNINELLKLFDKTENK